MSFTRISSLLTQDMRIEDLKAIARHMNLKDYGTKDTIINRIIIAETQIQNYFDFVEEFQSTGKLPQGKPAGKVGRPAKSDQKVANPNLQKNSRSIDEDDDVLPQISESPIKFASPKSIDDDDDLLNDLSDDLSDDLLEEAA